MTIIELKAAIESKKAEIKEKQAEMDSFEYESSYDEYNDYLDSEGPVNVLGMEFYPSDILKNCDPVAYRCGKIDFDSNFDITEVEEYIQLDNEREELEDELEDLEAELEEAEENEEENN